MTCSLASEIHCVLHYINAFKIKSKCFFHRDTTRELHLFALA